ncbi:putative transposase-like protein [Lasius niger]|uniref:Putative transposase-like protein n=1 Tax=Lasius niger TaxID=67767 RepID=A0A0J7K865_LASNI|nr:putative transposase-like protein [Lasius niger]
MNVAMNLAESKLSCATCMPITYSFAVNFTFEQTMRESSIIEGQQISRETVADRFSFCREVCMVGRQIGGVGEIVEIDECKIGRRKYERERVVEGSWILGIIHRGYAHKYRLEICPDNKRDENTLIELIKKHVAAGTEIHTDCWKGYINLENHGYVYKTVNHSEEFVNHDTGTHTENIESSWRWMRRFLSRGGVCKSNLADHLCEFLWRQRVKKLNVYYRL